jgi:DNA-binding transcriptional MerR regulator
VELSRSRRWQAREFANLTGVTVRTLHHYDRLGLLKPAGGRTQAGYRIYGESDLARLEQIVVLKFLGLPLKQIRDLLDRNALAQSEGLAAVLRLQKGALLEKRRRLDAALSAIGEAQRALAAGADPDLKNIIEVMDMQNDTEWMMRYYNDEARAKVEERKSLWSPELQAQTTKDWEQLGRDVEAALGEDPAGAAAQALAARWRKLMAGFTGGDPSIQAGLNTMHADRNNWKVDYRMPYSEAAGAFMQKALALSAK